VKWRARSDVDKQIVVIAFLEPEIEVYVFTLGQRRRELGSSSRPSKVPSA
jgi:hypothetical protein